MWNVALYLDQHTKLSCPVSVKKQSNEVLNWWLSTFLDSRHHLENVKILVLTQYQRNTQAVYMEGWRKVSLGVKCCQKESL